MPHRYGIVSPPAIGHLVQMVALALELKRRGHAVVVFTVADGASKLAGLPLDVVTIGASAFPPDTVEEAYATTLGRPSGRDHDLQCLAGAALLHGMGAKARAPGPVGAARSSASRPT
jgi:hypothetical protein